MDKVLMNDILRVTGICPIIAYAEDDQAAPAAKALAQGGVPIVEVLLRNSNSYDNIEAIAKDAPEVIVGAGTVLNVEQVKKAVDLGAQFIIMPGWETKTVEYCLKNDIFVVPGCITPGEIATALSYGIDVVKFFPVYEMGGKDYLNMISGPFPTVKYMVTGGLNEVNFLPLLECPKVLASGGDWMFTEGNALVNRDYELIEKNLRKSVYQVQDLRNRMSMKK